eukprot:scaffold8556_cov286-Pinguiococcus_pyrenoidosus.AAC.7
MKIAQLCVQSVAHALDKLELLLHLQLVQLMNQIESGKFMSLVRSTGGLLPLTYDSSVSVVPKLEKLAQVLLVLLQRPLRFHLHLADPLDFTFHEGFHGCAKGRLQADKERVSVTLDLLDSLTKLGKHRTQIANAYGARRLRAIAEMQIDKLGGEKAPQPRVLVASAHVVTGALYEPL